MFLGGIPYKVVHLLGLKRGIEISEMNLYPAFFAMERGTLFFPYS